MDIEQRTKKIKKSILEIENFRSGSLSEQYNVCGKPGCRCKDTEAPKKHGPYYQASFNRDKKHSTMFVKKEYVKAIKREIKNYEKLKGLIDEWVNLSTTLSNQRYSTK